MNFPSNLIVKRKVLQLLAQASDFDQLKNNLQMQEEFIRGVMGIFASNDSADNADMCLK